jgi:orotate phosphoribosyltransferase
MLFGAESNLDLAQALFDLGGVEFGEFNLGPTAGMSPIYLNPRVVISHPTVMRQFARLVHHEIQADQQRRRPRLAHFGAVAGVPMGGLHLATAYSLISDSPLIYVRANVDEPVIEGRIIPGQTVLIIDDLMTGGTSILQTARALEEGVVPDAGSVDLGMIMGTGFPPFRGGPFRYVDAVGAELDFAFNLHELGDAGARHTRPGIGRHASEPAALIGDECIVLQLIR